MSDLTIAQIVKEVNMLTKALWQSKPLTFQAKQAQETLYAFLDQHIPPEDSHALRCLTNGLYDPFGAYEEMVEWHIARGTSKERIPKYKHSVRTVKMPLVLQQAVREIVIPNNARIGVLQGITDIKFLTHLPEGSSVPQELANDYAQMWQNQILKEIGDEKRTSAAVARKVELAKAKGVDKEAEPMQAQAIAKWMLAHMPREEYIEDRQEIEGLSLYQSIWHHCIDLLRADRDHLPKLSLNSRISSETDFIRLVDAVDPQNRNAFFLVETHQGLIRVRASLVFESMKILLR
jgi:hypothetical protein